MSQQSNRPVIWLTGLSAAGKTTLGAALVLRLEELGVAVKWLDGDRVRRGPNRDLGYSREDRDENVRRLGRSAKTLSERGFAVIVSAVSPFRAVRDEVRGNIPGFVEVYVSAPLAVCEARDGKNLYRRARAGLLCHVPGIDLPYERPLQAELECRTDIHSAEECASQIVEFLVYGKGEWASQLVRSRSSSADSFKTSSR
jgi:adenylylsulfate kinase